VSADDETDYEGAYRELRLRVTDLLRDRPDVVLEQLAPATPGWRVRDIVAHLGGVCDDIANGNLDGVATERWTGAQVQQRRDWSFERVLEDWSEHAAVVEPMMNSIGLPMGQMVFDAWSHEQDVRGAIGEPGAREGPAADLSFRWFVATNRAAAPPAEGGPGALLLITDDGEYTLGAGEPVTTVRTSRYEFLRAVTGRRSRAQIRALETDGPELDGIIFFHEFFTPAATDIVE
jgi:uncharacterized protein (TIGR03083 family)